MTNMLLRFFLVFSLLLPLAAPAQAADATALPSGSALARDLAVRLDKLRVDVTMTVYDESITAYNDSARDGIAAMATQAEAFREELAARDAAAAQTFAANWTMANNTLLGGGDFSEGILTLGYDAAQHAYFGDSMQQLAEIIAKSWPVEAATPEEQAARLVARALANYILAAASPFGAYTASFNAGDADDPEVMVPRVTAALEALRAK